MAVSSVKKKSSDIREASEWLERRLAWVMDEWKARGIPDYRDPDSTELVGNIMSEVVGMLGMLGERFEFKYVCEDRWHEVSLGGVHAASKQNVRTALYAWVSRARLRIAVATDEGTAESNLGRAA